MVAIPATMASADTDDTYTPDEYTLTVSVTTATVGVPFTATVTGPADNSSFTLEVPGVDDSGIEVAGAQTAATTDGVSNFSVTLPEAGTYPLTATNDDGQVVGTATVVAVAAGEDGTSAGIVDGQSTTSGGGGLPVTGATSMPYLLTAAALLLLGGGALVVARVRGRSHRAVPGDSAS